MATTLQNLLIETKPNGKATITVYCMQCDGRFTKRGVPMDDLLEVGAPSRRLIQDIFPTWSMADRELYFMSNICKKCFDKLLVWNDED